MSAHGMAFSTETPADRIPWALRIEYLANNNPWPSTETPVYEHAWLPTANAPAYNTPLPSSVTPVHGLQWFLTCGDPATAKMTPGSIYYLPPRRHLSLGQQHVTGNLPPGIFSHPVLILRTCARTSTVEFLIMTTLDGKPLKKYAKKPSRRAHLVPLFPNDPHPDNGSLVHLKNEWSLPKKGYIGTDKRFTMPCDILEPLFDQEARQFELRDDDLRHIDIMSAFSPRHFSRPESPCSSRSRSRCSSMSSISSFGSPPSSVELAGQRIQYSKRKLLSLRPAAISQSSLLACLKTEDFDLLKQIQKDTTDAATGKASQHTLPTPTMALNSSPQQRLRSHPPDTRSGSHPLYWAPAEGTATTTDPWREIDLERERISRVLLKRKDMLQGIQINSDSFKPASCHQQAKPTPTPNPVNMAPSSPSVFLEKERVSRAFLKTKNKLRGIRMDLESFKQLAVDKITLYHQGAERIPTCEPMNSLETSAGSKHQPVADSNLHADEPVMKGRGRDYTHLFDTQRRATRSTSCSW